MKAGRPTYRVKAKWVSFQGPDDETFYELNQKGELIKVNRSLKPHHVRPLSLTSKESNAVDSATSELVKPCLKLSSEPLPAFYPVTESQDAVDLTGAFRDMDSYFSSQLGEESSVNYDFMEFIEF